MYIRIIIVLIAIVLPQQNLEFLIVLMFIAYTDLLHFSHSFSWPLRRTILTEHPGKTPTQDGRWSLGRQFTFLMKSWCYIYIYIYILYVGSWCYHNCLNVVHAVFSQNHLLFLCPQDPSTAPSAKPRTLPSTQITTRERRGHASASHPKPGQSVRTTHVSIPLSTDSHPRNRQSCWRLCRTTITFRLSSSREDRDHFRRKAAAYPPIRERSPLRREVARSPHSRSGSSVSSRGYSPDRAKGLPFPAQQGKSM